MVLRSPMVAFSCGLAHPAQTVESVLVCAFQEQGARDAGTPAPCREMQGRVPPLILGTGTGPSEEQGAR